MSDEKQETRYVPSRTPAEPAGQAPEVTGDQVEKWLADAPPWLQDMADGPVPDPIADAPWLYDL